MNYKNKRNVLFVLILFFLNRNSFCQISENLITKDSGWILGNVYENKFLYEENVFPIKDFLSLEIKKIPAKLIPKGMKEQEKFLMDMFKQCENLTDTSPIPFTVTPLPFFFLPAAAFCWEAACIFFIISSTDWFFFSFFFKNFTSSKRIEFSGIFPSYVIIFEKSLFSTSLLNIDFSCK